MKKCLRNNNERKTSLEVNKGNSGNVKKNNICMEKQVCYII